MGCGCNSSCDCSQVITIPTGPLGPPGPAGAAGSNGSNGTNGTNGTDGAAATIAVGTVTTGAPGSSATVANSGTSAAAVFDFAIPAGAAGSGVSVTTVTHTELLSLIGSSGLTPGGLYRMAYQTKHLIAGTSEYNYNTTTHDSGTGVAGTFTPATENLLLRAITAEKIDIRVLSESYPRDIIYYDYSLTTTEDGSQPRPGFITYRENPDDDISAPYDFRNVLHRRFTMNLATDRTADFQTGLGNPGGTLNYKAHPFVATSIPPFVLGVDGLNAVVGMVTTAHSTIFRDFKTFVGYDDLLWKGAVGGASAEKPRFKNVHIKHSDLVAKVDGSATGTTTTSAGGVFGGTYPALADVVIFSRAAENITIGQNAAGITITGRSNSNIAIGNNNENIIIGGSKTALDYTTSGVPKTLGFNENIDIGNDNRNVHIDSDNRRITIGDKNIGIQVASSVHNFTVGSYNTSIYNLDGHDVYIEDWCSTIRMSDASNVKIESKCTDIDLVYCQNAPAKPTVQAGRTKHIAEGYRNTIEDYSENMQTIEIKANSFNILLHRCAGIKLGAQCYNTFMSGCTEIVMGDLCYNNSIVDSWSIDFGQSCYHNEIVMSKNMTLGNQCSENKMVQMVYLDIGDSVTYGYFSYGIDNTFGNNCSHLFSQRSNRINVGDFCESIYTRNSTEIDIGAKTTSVFINIATTCSVGSGCAGIVMSDLNCTQYPMWNGMSPGLNQSGSASVVGNEQTHYHYNFFTKIPELDTYTTRTYVGINNPGSGKNPYESGDKEGLSNYISATAAAVIENHVGNGCENIGLIGSSYSTVGNNSIKIMLGCEEIIDYIYEFNLGIEDPTGSTPAYTVSNIQGITGLQLNASAVINNTVGEACQNIILSGTMKYNNEFGKECGDITVPSAIQFNHCKVLTNGKPVTVARPIGYTNECFQFNNKGIDAYSENIATLDRWSHRVDNTTGLLVAATGATATITITTPGSSGTITSIVYAGTPAGSGASATVNIFNPAGAVTGATVNDLAADLASKINSHTSVPNFTASVVGAVVTITVDPAEGAFYNGYLASPVTTGGVNAVATGLAGGITSSATKLV